MVPQGGSLGSLPRSPLCPCLIFLPVSPLPLSASPSPPVPPVSAQTLSQGIPGLACPRYSFFFFNLIFIWLHQVLVAPQPARS